MTQQNASTPDHRRAGGSAARRAQRAQSRRDRVVHAGLDGGRYRCLDEADLVKIYRAALEVLATIGMGTPTPELLEIALPKGCQLDANGRLLFPTALVEDLIDIACKEFTHYAPNPAYDLQIGGRHVNFRTNGTAPGVLDFATRKVRRATILDVYDFARLGDQLEHIHGFTQTVLAAELCEDPFVHDMNVLYALLSGSQKPLAMDVLPATNVDHLVRMLDLYLGEEGAFVRRPFVLFEGCPVVSPLRWGADNLAVMVRCAQLGLPYDIAVAPQAGATAPAALAGALVQVFAETLASLAVVNLINPGNAFMMGHWPFISDLRTGAFTGGSGEQALVGAAVTQLCNYLGLPSSTAACMSDSKLPDGQAGYEKGITATLVAHAGCNYIAESFGMLGSLMACSYEAMVLDNDMVGNVMRTLRGIEVDDETLSIEEIRKTVFGAGHYLGSAATLARMETEYLYPTLADRQSYGAWEQQGSHDAFESAHQRARKLLSGHYPDYMNSAADARIRAHFPIRMRPEDMRAGNGRW